MAGTGSSTSVGWIDSILQSGQGSDWLNNILQPGNYYKMFEERGAAQRSEAEQNKNSAFARDMATKEFELKRKLAMRQMIEEGRKKAYQDNVFKYFNAGLTSGKAFNNNTNMAGA